MSDSDSQRTSSLNWNKSYVYLSGRLLATQKVGLPAQDTTQFHHPDRLGTRLVTNGADGAIVSEQVGMPYGTMLANGVMHGEGSYQDSSMNRANQSQKRFTSYDRSATTGLDYAVNRYYSAAQGRFTQVDPIGMSAASLSDPQTLNLYSYCANDPINHVDPDGLFFGKLFGWIGRALGSAFKVFAVVLAVVAVLAVSWGFGALALKAVIGAGVFALMGWGNSRLGQAIGAAFFGGGFGSLRTPHTFPQGSGVGGVSNFLVNDPLQKKKAQEEVAKRVGKAIAKNVIRKAFRIGDIILEVAFPEPAGGGADLPYEEHVRQAQKQYPNLAGRTEYHHVIPKYLGGDPNGVTVPLDAAYHRVITHRFRDLWPYGTGRVPNSQELKRILETVYSQHPLPKF